MAISSSPKVIVIGAGVVGCSLAFHLARANASVIVFDKGDICAGMSARSGALIRMHYTFAPEVELAWKSLRYFSNWREIVGGDCGFVPTGFALVAGHNNAERMRRNVAMMQSLGVEVELCNRTELQKIDSSVNVSDIALAAYEPQSGYADPVATTRSLAAAAKRHGAAFVLNSPVSEVLVKNEHALGIRCADGRTFTADAVCIAAGPWTSGTGFKTSPAVGAAMAELILNGRSHTADISPFAFERILSGRLIRTENEYVMGTGFGHSL